MKALKNSPSPRFIQHSEALRLDPALLEPLESTADFLLECDAKRELLSVVIKDMYALVRSSVVLLDLSMPSYGEQGHDALFAWTGGIPVVGLTDRFQHAPAIAAKLDVLIAPNSVDEIVRIARALMGVAGESSSPKSEAPQPTAIPSSAPRFDGAFAASVIAQANQASKKTDGATEDRVP